MATGEAQGVMLFDFDGVLIGPGSERNDGFFGDSELKPLKNLDWRKGKQFGFRCAGFGFWGAEFGFCCGGLGFCCGRFGF
jgi:hypothetical protein